MSVPFTVNGTNWQEKAEELRLAYSERARIIGSWKGYGYIFGSWVYFNVSPDDSSLQGGENLQAVTFFNGLQAGAESLLDYASKFGHDFSSSDTLRYYTNFPNPFLQFCKEVGGLLYESDEDYGWPKCSSLNELNEPVMTRGRFAVGDYVTAQMVDALVLAFENLTVFNIGVKGSSSDTGTLYEGSSPLDPLKTNDEILQEAYDNALDNPSTIPVDPDSDIRGTGGTARVYNSSWNIEFELFDNDLVIDTNEESIAVGSYEIWGVKTFETNYTFNPNGLIVDVSLPGAPYPWPNVLPPWYPSGGTFVLADQQRYSSIVSFDFTNA